MFLIAALAFIMDGIFASVKESGTFYIRPAFWVIALILIIFYMQHRAWKDADSEGVKYKKGFDLVVSSTPDRLMAQQVLYLSGEVSSWVQLVNQDQMQKALKALEPKMLALFSLVGRLRHHSAIYEKGMEFCRAVYLFLGKFDDLKWHLRETLPRDTVASLTNGVVGALTKDQIEKKYQALLVECQSVMQPTLDT